MKNKMAVALGRRGGKAKNAKMTSEERKAMMEKVRTTRWPQKLHTMKKPCTFPNCKVTVNHEHI